MNEIKHYKNYDNINVHYEYGYEDGLVVREYLRNGYVSEENQCELEALGKKYKVLKRGDVTAFYDEMGNTLFDVTAERLAQEHEWYEATETEPSEEPSQIGKVIESIEHEAFDNATVYMGESSLADIVTGNVPNPTPEEIEEAVKLQNEAKDGLDEEEEEVEQDSDSDDADIEEAGSPETQEVSKEDSQEEKEDNSETTKGIDGAISKLQRELKNAKESYAEPILTHMIERCRDSETLAEAVCQKHKTWDKCFKYIMDQARKMKSGNCAMVKDSVVYEWAEDYFRLDDKALEEKKAKEAAAQKAKRDADNAKKSKQTIAPKKAEKSEEKPKAVKSEAPKAESKPEAPKTSQNKSNEMDGQMDLFSMMGF